MKNQALYDALDISFPDAPRSVAGEDVVLGVDGIAVTMNQAGLNAYRNEHAKGDAFRKAILLGINALSYEGDQGLDPRPYASIAYRKDRAVTVCFERDHEALLASLQGARAVLLCVTPPVPEAMTRNDLLWGA